MKSIKITLLASCVAFSAQGSFDMDSAVAKAPQAKPLRNTIMSSVKNNPSKPFDATPFSFDLEPKIATEPKIFTPKKSFSLTDALPKLSDVKDASALPLPVKLEIKPEESIEPKKDLPKKVSINKALPFDIKKLEDAPSREVKSEPGVLYQEQGFVGDDPATIAFNFEDASLNNLLSYIEVVHSIKFITEDIVIGAKDAKGAVVAPVGVAGHKITFRTNRNLTRKESWELFLTFMHIAGLDVIPTGSNKFYRVVPLTKANNEPIPTYIGVDPAVLPDSDMIIRYVYFTRNVDPAKLQPILKTMQSGSAKLDVYGDLKGLIFTDRACSIKSLMQIVTEIDGSVPPEVVSVVKLKRANVDDVIKLLNTLKPNSGAGPVQPQKVWAPAGKKESTLDYFPSDVSLVGDKRTNSLIVLGVARDVQRIEEFVTKYIDMAVDRTAPPIFTHRLQYTNAKDIVTILNSVISYGSNTPAGQVGGVRDGIKFFQKMTIVADSFTNSLIINSTPEDYQALLPLIKDLDVAQKQVGIEVLIVQVKDADVKTLGAQISGPNGINSPVPGASPYGPTFGQSMSAQTSGINPGTPIVVTPGLAGQDDFSIKSSLASLLGGNVLNEVGSVLVTFGKPIWAIFKVLKTITSTHVIANPFIVVTNNSTASITSGEERRQVSGEVVSANGTTTKGLTPVQALLTVKITPQINKGNIINLGIHITNELFTQPDSQISGGNTGSPRDKKEIKTMVSVANGETLVLGGIMSESYANSSTGVPFLENIPVFGWFFKSKNRKVNRDHFMIFICPRMLDPVADNASVDHYTSYKMHQVEEHLDLIDESDWFASGKDPIQKAFFNTGDSPSLQQLHIGKNYEKRERLDGKIDDKRKRKPKNNKVKSRKFTKETVRSTKGVHDGA